MYYLVFLTILLELFCMNYYTAKGQESSVIYSMPLVRRKSPLNMLINDPNYMNKLKINKNHPTNDNITLFKYLDTEYYAQILVGRPGKEFTVIFDTTWGDMWLPSVLCSPILFPICGVKNKYDGSRSSTHKPIYPKPFNVSGLVGNLTCDTVRLPHLNVSDLIFAEISEISNDFDYQFMHADGAIGLGYKNIARTTNLPFFYKLLNDKKILKPIFSLYMNRDETTPKGGQIFLGGINPKHMKGQITYVPVVEKGYWQIEMDQFSVQLNKTYAKPFCEKPCKVILDSSSNKIGVPKQITNVINSLIGAVHYFHNRYTVSCLKVRKLPIITLNFGGRDFHIHGRDYIQKIEKVPDGMICMSAFSDTLLDGNLWSLGGGFLSSVYTTFDLENNRVGFANLQKNKTSYSIS